MKLLKEKSRTYKGKPYYKYRVNIPEIFLLNAGIKVGDHLEVGWERGKIILKKIETDV